MLPEKFYGAYREAFVKSCLRAHMMVVPWDEGSLNRYIHMDMVDGVPSDCVRLGLSDGVGGVVTPECSTQTTKQSKIQEISKLSR